MPEATLDQPKTETPKADPFDTAMAKAFDDAETARDTKPTETDKPEKAVPPDEPKAAKKPDDDAASPKAEPKSLFKKAAAEDGNAVVKPPEQDGDKSSIDAITEPQFKDEKGKAGWTALKSEAKNWEKKALDMERQISERKAAGKDSETLEARLAEKEKQLAEWSDLVTRAKLESHPEWKREITVPQEAAVKRAMAVVKESGGDAEAIRVAINLPPGEEQTRVLAGLLEDLPAFQQARLGRALDELTALRDKAEAKRANAAESYAQIQEQERQRETQERERFVKEGNAAFEKAVRKLRTEIPFLQKLDGNEAWNADGEEIIKSSRERFTNETMDEAAENIILAKSTRPMLKMIESQITEIETLGAKNKEMAEELKAIHGKSPSLRSGGRGAEGGDKAAKFDEAMDASFGGA